MRLQKLVFMTVFALSFMIAGQSQAQVKSYREWKADQVQQAENRVTFYKAQLTVRKHQRSVANGQDPNLATKNSMEAVASQNINIEKLEKQLRDETYGLEIAQDLTVTDYFVGYLTKVQDKKSAFNEVAGKLSSEEIAELMMAYANSVFGAQSTDLPTSALNMPKEASK